MKKTSLNFIVYPHVVLLVWAMLFLISLFMSDGGKTAGVLAIGNFLFLFVNIPFALFSLALKVKGCFSKKHDTPIVVLSFLNIVVGIIAWLLAVLLLQMP